MSARSLEGVASTDPSAKDALALLDMSAFMHRQDVSEDMFARAWSYEGEILSRYEGEYKEEDQEINHLSPWHAAQCRNFLPPQLPE